MRFAIIAHGYSGATLPIAKHLGDMGHSVDCYYFCWHGATEMESIEYGKKMKGYCFSHQIKRDNTLFNYIKSNACINIIPVFNPKNTFGKTRNAIQNICNNIHVKLLADQIRRKRYDLVNVILYTDFDYAVLDYLISHGVNCCVSFHEVLSNLTTNANTIPVVEKACRLNTQIVVHSEKTKDDLLKNYNVAIERIHLIHFGLFESFTQYNTGKEITGLGTNFLLYLGFIKPYKGLSVLYEASQRLRHIDNLKIIVAGGGYDTALDKMREDNRFIVINRFIDNAELAFLMQQCKGVVCPYIGASQSGLVQTAMVFNKPIVATRVGAFAELIQENLNGHLANPSDAQDLADAIERLYNHTTPYVFTLPESFDWNYIANQYLQLV